MKLELPEECCQPRLFMQDSLIEGQLPKFLQRLLDAGAEIQSVFLTYRFGLGGRYTVVYSHTEEISSEVYC